jgi:glutamine amidotransferase
MCRHLAYLGPPTPLRSVLIDPPHGLYRQSWAPRMQRYGTVNADGFGIGWYADGDPVPARYRRGVPIWGDPSLPDLARVISSGAVLAAVRSATPGTAPGESAAAPFASGPWLFSHNGVLAGWPGSAAALAGPGEASASPAPPGQPAPPGASGPPAPPGASGPPAPPGADECDSQPPIAGSMPHSSVAEALLSLEAMVDSAFLWLLVRKRLRAGTAADLALAATIGSVEAAGGSGRFNFLLTDGRSITATTAGDTLWYRRAVGAVTVASEPCDDDPGWTEVPDRQVLTAAPTGVTIRPLASLTAVTESPAEGLTEGIAIR